MFAEILNYRLYFLNDAAIRRSARETGRVKSFGAKFEMILKVRNFDGLDWVLIFAFLRNLIREANIAAMSEAQL